MLDPGVLLPCMCHQGGLTFGSIGLGPLGGGSDFCGASYFWVTHFAPALPFPPQKMPESMLLDDLQLEENATSDDAKRWQTLK